MPAGRGPAHAREGAPRVPAFGSYLPPARNRAQDILESDLPHGVMLAELYADVDADADVEALAERLERHAPAADASWGACVATARRMLGRPA